MRVVAVFCLLLCGVAASQSPFEKVSYPARVRYHQQEPAKLQALADKLSRQLASEDASWLGQTTLIGPIVWAQIAEANAFSAAKGPPSHTFIPLGDEFIIVEGKGLRDQPSKLALVKWINKTVGSEPKLRRIRLDEMNLLWSLVGFDLEDPLLVLQGEKRALVLLFGEGKLLLLEDLSVPKLEILAALPGTQTTRQRLQPELEVAAGQNYEQSKNLRQALIHYERALSDRVSGPTQLRALEGAARCHQQFQDHDGLVDKTTQLLELEPKNLAALSNRAWAYMALKETELALADLEAVLTLVPAKSESAYQCHAEIGTAHMVAKDYDKAIQEFTICIEGLPKFQPAYLNLAYALSESGDKEKAYGVLTRVLEGSPELAAAWNNRGYLLAELGRYQEALSDIEKSLELEPDNLSTLDSKGYILIGMKRYQEAVTVLDSILKRTPADSRVLYCRGVAQQELGNSEAAARDFKKAEEIEPGIKVEWAP